MSQSTLRGPGGNATADSNQGEPFKYTVPPVDCANLGAFQEVMQIPLSRDVVIGRPTQLRGEMVITAAIGITTTAVPANLGTMGIEVRVDAYNSSQATRIASALLGGQQPVLRVDFRESDTFDRLVVIAAGSNQGQSPFILSTPLLAGTVLNFATLTASLLMWR